MVKNKPSSLLMVFAVHILLGPVHLFSFVVLAFNDTGWQAESLAEFFPALFPVGFIIVLHFIAYFVLWKLKCHKRILHCVYIPVCIFIAVIFTFFYMDAFLPHEFNKNVNPLTISYLKSQERGFQRRYDMQGKAVEKYLKNPSKYETLYEIQEEAGTLAFVMDAKDRLYAYYKSDEGEVFLKLRKEEDWDIKHRYPLTQAEKSEMYLVEDTQSYFALYLPSKNLIFSLKHYDAILSGESKSIDHYLKELIMSHLEFYGVTYEDGKLYRTGSLEDDVHWVITVNGEQILSRVATNELELDLLLLSEALGDVHGRYRAYLTTFIDGKYRKVSNMAYWIQ